MILSSCVDSMKGYSSRRPCVCLISHAYLEKRYRAKRLLSHWLQEMHELMGRRFKLTLTMKLAIPSTCLLGLLVACLPDWRIITLDVTRGDEHGQDKY